MEGTERKVPGEDIASRLSSRWQRRPRMGMAPAFYARFGLEDPWLATGPVGGEGRDLDLVFLSAAPYYQHMMRLAAARRRRELRMSRFLAAHGDHAVTATRRAWPAAVSTVVGGAVSMMSAADMVLPPAPIAPAPAEEAVAAQPVSRPRWHRRNHPTRGVASPWLSREHAPAAVFTTPDGHRLHSEPSWEMERQRQPEIQTVDTKAARSPASRPLDRLNAVAHAPAQRSEPKVKAAVEALSSLGGGRRIEEALRIVERAGVVELREVVRVITRHIGVASRLVEVELESVLPDAGLRPSAIARGRTASVDAGPRGLRPALRSSPLYAPAMTAVVPPTAAPVEVAEAVETSSSQRRSAAARAASMGQRARAERHAAGPAVPTRRPRSSAAAAFTRGARPSSSHLSASPVRRSRSASGPQLSASPVISSGATTPRAAVQARADDSGGDGERRPSVNGDRRAKSGNETEEPTTAARSLRDAARALPSIFDVEAFGDTSPAVGRAGASAASARPSGPSEVQHSGSGARLTSGAVPEARDRLSWGDAGEPVAFQSERRLGMSARAAARLEQAEGGVWTIDREIEPQAPFVRRLERSLATAPAGVTRARHGAIVPEQSLLVPAAPLAEAQAGEVSPSTVAVARPSASRPPGSERRSAAARAPRSPGAAHAADRGALGEAIEGSVLPRLRAAPSKSSVTAPVSELRASERASSRAELDVSEERSIVPRVASRPTRKVAPAVVLAEALVAEIGEGGVTDAQSAPRLDRRSGSAARVAVGTSGPADAARSVGSESSLRDGRGSPVERIAAALPEVRGVERLVSGEPPAAAARPTGIAGVEARSRGLASILDVSEHDRVQDRFERQEVAVERDRSAAARIGAHTVGARAAITAPAAVPLSPPAAAAPPAEAAPSATPASRRPAHRSGAAVGRRRSAVREARARLSLGVEPQLRSVVPHPTAARASAPVGARLAVGSPLVASRSAASPPAMMAPATPARASRGARSLRLPAALLAGARGSTAPIVSWLARNTAEPVTAEVRDAIVEMVSRRGRPGPASYARLVGGTRVETIFAGPDATPAEVLPASAAPVKPIIRVRPARVPPKRAARRPRVTAAPGRPLEWAGIRSLQGLVESGSLSSIRLPGGSTIELIRPDADAADTDSAALAARGVRTSRRRAPEGVNLRAEATGSATATTSSELEGAGEEVGAPLGSRVGRRRRAARRAASRHVSRSADGRYVPAAGVQARRTVATASELILPSAGLDVGVDPAARTAETARWAGAGAGGAELGRTLNAVERGEVEQDLPSWAQRASGEPLVRGTGGDIVAALARASDPEEVVRVIIERGSALGALASTLPRPLLQVIEQIRSESQAERLSEAEGVEGGSVAGSTLRPSSPRAASSRGPARSSARVMRGFTNLSVGARPVEGVGQNKITKLAAKLQQLILLAENQQRDTARRQVRMAEDNSQARAEGQGAVSGPGNTNNRQVDLEALAHEVTETVLREIELRRERRPEDPDERSVWW